jgi:DNA (cytosine-5)-methyltransferase 1
MIYTKDNPLRVCTLCSGYDSQCLALERLKRDFPPFDYELVAWSEFEPETPNIPLEKQAAVRAHNALFPQWADRNWGDMTKIDWEKVPDFDLLFYSTPCQSISQAGLQHGFVEGSGTRSSIIWCVRDALRIKKPKYACLENVAAMVSSKFLPMFNLWRDEVRRLGYNNFAEVLNAKDYGIPQNRERIFLLSIRDDGENPQYYFPNKMKLIKSLKDILEDDVDVKYYLNPNKVDQFVRDNMVMIEKYAREDDGAIEPLPDHLRKWLEEFPESDTADGGGEEQSDDEQETCPDIFACADE